jgi:transcription initiation factor IIE alpha subunit
MKYKVHDIIFRERTVEIPGTTCPECGADLTAEDAVKTVEWQDYRRYQSIVAVDGGHVLEPNGDVPLGIDCFLEENHQCAKCKYDLAEGDVQFISPGDGVVVTAFEELLGGLS